MVYFWQWQGSGQCSAITAFQPSSWQLQIWLLLSQPLTALCDKQLASLGLGASRTPALAPAQDRSFGNPPRQHDSKCSSPAGPALGGSQLFLVQEELTLGCEDSCTCMTERAGKHLSCMPEWWKSNWQQINMPVPVLPCFEEWGVPIGGGQRVYTLSSVSLKS